MQSCRRAALKRADYFQTLLISRIPELASTRNLSRADGGVDSAFFLDTEEMKQLVIETERAWQSLAQVTYGPTEEENPSLKFRRSLNIAKDVKAGEELTSENIRIVRPGMGLEPK